MAVIVDVNKAVIARRKGGRGSTKKNKTQKDADQIPSNKPIEKDTLFITGIEDKEIMLGSNEERESLVNEEGTKENSMPFSSGNVEKETGVLEPLESNESRGITWLNDIMDCELLQSDGDSMNFSMTENSIE